MGKDYRSFLAYALADAANRNTTPPMNYEYANYMQAGAGMRHGANKEAMVLVLDRWTMDGHDMTLRAGGRTAVPCRVDCER